MGLREWGARHNKEVRLLMVERVLVKFEVWGKSFEMWSWKKMEKMVRETN